MNHYFKIAKLEKIENNSFMINNFAVLECAHPKSRPGSKSKLYFIILLKSIVENGINRVSFLNLTFFDF